MSEECFLVIPSIREAQFNEFMTAWDGRGGWTKVILVEDNPTKTFTPSLPVDYHFAWRDIERIAGRAAWIFSRRDSAIRAFGFLCAHACGADSVVTLDDDVRPTHSPDGPDFVTLHREAVTGQPRWASSVPGVRVRGLPYGPVGELPAVVANVGLWSDVADFDAVTSLYRMGAGLTEPFTPPPGSRVIPAGQYVPVCGMNLFMRRCALPLFYFPLMGEDEPYARFDDIWAGVMAKKLMDHLGWRLAVGTPHVRHLRASNPFVNAIKEAPGLTMNEKFWRYVDAVQLKDTDPIRCIHQLAAGLAPAAEAAGLGRNAELAYLERLGRSLDTWAQLFNSDLDFAR